MTPCWSEPTRLWWFHIVVSLYSVAPEGAYEVLRGPDLIMKSSLNQPAQFMFTPQQICGHWFFVDGGSRCDAPFHGKQIWGIFLQLTRIRHQAVNTYWESIFRWMKSQNIFWGGRSYVGPKVSAEEPLVRRHCMSSLGLCSQNLALAKCRSSSRTT